MIRSTTNTTYTRRGVLAAFAATAVSAAPSYANAAGFLRGAGDVRTLRMFSDVTGEGINAIYWVDGHYIDASLDQISHFMRDWREDQSHAIDARTIDVIVASYRVLDASAPIQLLSGYRTKRTNAMLRRRSRGVAKRSLHIEGKAVDIRIAGCSTRQLSRVAASLKAGGVGRYSKSGFVHLDCGQQRIWGR